VKAYFSIGKMARQPGEEDCKTPTGVLQRIGRTGVPLLLVVAILTTLLEAPGVAGTNKALEFRGQVVIPPKALIRGRRITLTLSHVSTSFHARTRSDFDGRFRFRNIPSGTYSLSIIIPGAGEFRSTVDVTPAFADEHGRVEKQFSYDEETLADDAMPLQQGMVSVRELSIPRRALQEYSAARDDLHREKVESARRHLEKAVEVAPQFLEAINYLGVLAYQRRDFSKAEEYFRSALKVDAESYEPLVNLGGTLLSLGRSAEALEVNRRAQAAQPNDALSNSQLGLSYYLLGKDEEALNYLLLAEQIDPAHFTNPQIPLANIYLRYSQVEAAIEELEDFLERHPDSPEAESVQTMLRKIRDGGESATAVPAAYE
jgi:Tfp pilus assembly protein PilF